MNQTPHIFNRARVLAHKNRAAKDFAQHDFLFNLVEERIKERLSEIKKTFTSHLDISGNPEKIDQHFIKTESLEADDGAYDLIISSGGLHWVNDLPGALIQIQRALKPDGLFIAVMPGGETLKELRQSFEQAEIAIKGGVSPRVSPFIDVRDAGSLLQRAGFSLPVVDSEIITVEYEHPLKLLHDIKGMGESNALNESTKTFTSASLIMAMCDYYLQHFKAPEGRVAASFELVTLTGWKPHGSQQQPSKRGSGKINLGDILSS